MTDDSVDGFRRGLREEIFSLRAQIYFAVSFFLLIFAVRLEMERQRCQPSTPTQFSNMELISSKRNILGTMSFTLKLGKMKKAEEFCTYPVQRGDDGSKVFLQSSHRWAELNTRTGEIALSARRAQYADSLWLMQCKAMGTAETDRANTEQLNEMLNAIRGTRSSLAGTNGIMYCDNSNADAV